MKNIVKIGSEPITENGSSLVLKLPRRWLASYGLEIHSPIFSVLTMDEIIRVYLQPQNHARSSLIRKVNGNCHMTLAKEHVRDLGLSKGDVLEMSVNRSGGVLLLRRA